MASLQNCITALTLGTLLAGCTSSPTDRNQFVIYSEEMMAEQGISTYREMQSEIPVSRNAELTDYVRCVTGYVVEGLTPEQRGDYQWEVTLFENDTANAFALPGGKMGVFTGLLDVAVNQHQVATVMAHEVGHVLARHSAERASRNTLRGIGVLVAQQAGVSSDAIELIDYGANLGLFLPFNRVQESEADEIGIMLMARAGFDPQESINLWYNMDENGGARPPEFMSTHPSPQTRISDLRDLLPQAEQQWLSARNRGLDPNCRAPGF